LSGSTERGQGCVFRDSGKETPALNMKEPARTVHLGNLKELYSPNGGEGVLTPKVRWGRWRQSGLQPVEALATKRVKEGIASGGSEGKPRITSKARCWQKHPQHSQSPDQCGARNPRITSTSGARSTTCLENEPRNRRAEHNSDPQAVMLGNNILKSK